MKLSMQEIGLLNLLESATGAQGRDAVAVGEKLVFVVNEGQLGRAIGKGGEGLRRLEARVGKQVEVVEYAEGAEKFARNLFAPVNAENVEVKNGTAFVRFKGEDKGRAIGRGGEKAERARALLERFHGLKLKIL
ncbi:hypothetical protein AUJ16_00685 [Candidatus Micrarchaeota archaeon CG1_02_60_51]|nr:MAG: hypothetical protein AUJ16_00685 [Candidatus Micrarchaeota archaeon CG1_02_60_51]